MKYFDQIIGNHHGRPAIIICGGPSAPEQFKYANKRLDDPVVISVNEHGCKLTKCDYSVSLDNILKKMKECDTTKITPYHWADVRLTGYWNAANSGRTACWVAWKLGCSPIVVVGADMYQGATYWWNKTVHSSGRNDRFEKHVKEWQMVKSRVPEEILTAVGGPLIDQDVFKKFDARRKYPQPEYKEQERIPQPVTEGDRIRILRGCWIEGQQYWPGEEVNVRSRSARIVTSIGKAEYVA